MPFNTANETISGVEDYEGKHLVGTVTNNVDPLGIGRVQASVPGLYDPQAGEVPWIGPKKDSPFGFGSGANGQHGVYGSPQIGDEIRVELQHGDEHYATYEPLYTQPNANSQFASPNVWGYKDPDGNYMIYDMETHTYMFVTRSGASIEIDANGKRITAVNGDNETSNGDWTLNVTGAITATCSGDASVHANGNIAVQAGGTASYTATLHEFHGPVIADQTIAAAGDITDLTGSGNSQTMHAMREAYNIHDHDVEEVQGGNDTVVSNPPIPQV